MQDLGLLLFKAWMSEYHPYYFLGYAIILTVLIISAIICFVLSFFVSWWYKALLITMFLIGLSYFVNKICVTYFYNDFLSGDRKITM